MQWLDRRWELFSVFLRFWFNNVRCRASSPSWSVSEFKDVSRNYENSSFWFYHVWKLLDNKNGKSKAKLLRESRHEQRYDRVGRQYCSLIIPFVCACGCTDDSQEERHMEITSEYCSGRKDGRNGLTLKSLKNPMIYGPFRLFDPIKNMEFAGYSPILLLLPRMVWGFSASAVAVGCCTALFFYYCTSVLLF